MSDAESLIDDDLCEYRHALDTIKQSSSSYTSTDTIISSDKKQINQEFEQFERSLKNQEPKTKLRPVYFYIVDIIFIFFLFLLLCFAVFFFYITYISILILIFVFIASFLISYIMSPIFLSLANDTLNTVAAFFQVILSSPLVVFMIYFLLKSIGKIEKFNNIFSFIWRMGKSPQIHIDTLLGHCLDLEEKYRNKKYYILYTLTVLGMSILSAGIDACIIILIIFIRNGYTVGILFLLPTCCDILILIVLIYLDFYRVLFCCNKHKMDDNSFVSIFDTTIEEIDPDKSSSSSESDDDHRKANQATQTFEHENGQFNFKIGYSSRKLDKSTIQSLDSIQIVKTTEKKSAKDCRALLGKILKLMVNNDITPFYQYAQSIERDRHLGYLKQIFISVFFVLNLALIGLDIYRLVQNYSSFFLASTILRLVLVPFFSYFHLLTQFFYRAKNKLIRYIFHFSAGGTLLIGLIILFVILFQSIYISEVRIKDLDFKPPNETIAYVNQRMLSHLACTTSFYDVSVIDAYGYSLGGYDVLDNPTVFDNQMKTFFGEDYSSHITYTVENVSGIFPFIIYHDSNINTSIVAFRGFNTGPELACWIDLLMNYYILPFFQDNIPFIELLIDFYLKQPTKTAHKFGKMMFDPTYLFKEFADTIINISLQHNLDKQERVIFTGIGVGGAFAKIAGIHLKKMSLGLLTLPITNDLIFDSFEIEEDDMIFVNTLYIPKTIFARSEPDFAGNIGLFQLDFSNPHSFCTAEICQFTMKKESYYPILCTMAGLCGKNAQFDHYCRSVIGDGLLETIHDSIMEL